jgi:hypothetical protein
LIANVADASADLYHLGIDLQTAMDSLHRRGGGGVRDIIIEDGLVVVVVLWPYGGCDDLDV